MFPIVILFTIGWILTLLASCMLLPVLFSLASEETAVAQSFLVIAVALGFIGGALLLALKDQKFSIDRKMELVIICTIWFVTPLCAALPLILSGFPGSLNAALFEAVSGFTTTGATVFADLADVPRGIIAWRSLLQWLGGLTTLMALAVALNPLIGDEVSDTHFRQVHRSSLATQRHAITSFRTIMPIYGGLTLLCFVLLMFANIPPFDALCLSLSTLSTGGFMPRSGTIELYGSPPAEFVLAIFMFLGCISILWLGAVFRFRWNVLKELPEPFWIAAAMVLFGLVVTVMLLQNAPDTGFLQLFRSWTLGLATAASYISTTGLTISERSHDAIPYVVMIIICLIGGGRFSTAGGLKFYRVLSMFRQSSRELNLLIFPHGVSASRFGRESRDNDVMRLIWANLFAVVTAIWILAVIVAATDVPLSVSFLASVSSISNIGPAFTFTRLPDFSTVPGFGELSAVAQIALAIGMIFGRLEFLALLSLANVVYWRS